MVPEILVDEPERLAEALASRLEAEVRHAVTGRGSFAVALAGGSMATAFFPRLARASADWSATEFFWADERAVPASDPDSNFALARSLWLEPSRVPAAHVHRMPADTADLAGAAEMYAAELVRTLGTPPRLDAVLLGMGPDGHVCSLFPGHALLDEERLWVAPVFDSPKPPSRRLTLTLPTLGAAQLVVVAVLGSARAVALRDALERPDSPLPIARLVRRARRMLLLADPQGASLIAAR
jgi:6-phosphogluconolactonase